VLEQDPWSPQILEYLRAGALVACFTWATVQDLIDGLFAACTVDEKLNEERVRQSLKALTIPLIAHGELVRQPPERDRLHVCVDPGDDRFLDCAREAEAFIVTNDQHLLRLDGQIRSKAGALIDVVTPQAFLTPFLQERMRLGTITGRRPR
jgi:predicted nucleic acid-binding protein